tara:strand:- start:381 stop:1052 length:672 start_codon:yes stop_codon:yes gene_type:complete
MKIISLPYKTARALIKEGDILLFRGQGRISKLIGAMTETNYSHVGVASWVNGHHDDALLECVEFKEGSALMSLINSNAGGGGRSINLEQAVKKQPDCIDVYRPATRFTTAEFNPETKEVEWITREFDGKCVTRVMRKMTGLPYGWKRIWWMIKHKLVLFRLRNRASLMNDELQDVIYPVCSTSLSYAFTKCLFDLVNNRADAWMEPGDIAKSARLNYLFTLGV